jgi:hypothetical protein
VSNCTCATDLVDRRRVRGFLYGKGPHCLSSYVHHRCPPRHGERSIVDQILRRNPAGRLALAIDCADEQRAWLRFSQATRGVEDYSPHRLGAQPNATAAARRQDGRRPCSASLTTYPGVTGRFVQCRQMSGASSGRNRNRLVAASCTCAARWACSHECAEAARDTAPRTIYGSGRTYDQFATKAELSERRDAANINDAMRNGRMHVAACCVLDVLRR